jgi:hypothetical protein
MRAEQEDPPSLIELFLDVGTVLGSQLRIASKKYVACRDMAGNWVGSRPDGAARIDALRGYTRSMSIGVNSQGFGYPSIRRYPASW